MKWRLVALRIGLLLIIPLAAVHTLLRASLPRLDGNLVQAGLVSSVLIARDRLGIPVVTANNRADLAFATGFLHAQDRFFQMDLSRRLAAGELAELFGPVALPHDRKARLFGFRQVARAALQQTSPEQRAVLEAYSRGVNSGLADLRSRPWEYWLLGSPPVPWRPEDSMLVTFAMWWDLQYSSIERDVDRLRINARLQGPECADGWKCALRFLFPARTEWDAPNGGTATGGGAASGGGAAADGRAASDGGTDPGAAIPAPEILDVRARTAQTSNGLLPHSVTSGDGIAARSPVD
ncbi:MAG: penicillin acylase family protein, partial [Sinobacteraceae bacterium]|nr:penicillin acylase family protein [Nevskiaceae bacterium]